ncbi:ABC transporter substrate-binding protein [Schleiferilactobacillus harbinensis]|uniref:ABC transporter substrate-binding protein n=1 Tax=Schleiferilactobacillus harbinensis TaxID=304207 RepID=UPI0011731817|nr:sugar ABC transporter substrate-binding protein [Schleiferilactobacillus harbinensis]GEK05232.1 sugar ABC transporter substrate-binding protein [Schleiferilactobacillus harbinensis]
MQSWLKKSGIIISLAAAALLILGGCGSGSSNSGSASSGSKKNEKVTLTVSTWNYDTTPEFAALFRAYEKEHPNVTIKNVDIAADQYDNKLTTMLAGGDTTDILTMKNLLSYSGYAYRNQLLDITSDVKKLNTKDYQGTIATLKTTDDKYYAIPYRNDFWVLYYNTELVKKAGVTIPDNMTWDQYEELAKKLTSGSGSDKVYGTYQHTWRSTIQAIAGAQTGHNLLKPNYEFMKPYYDRALAMQKAGYQMNYGTAKSTQTTYTAQFQTGKTAMMIMGTWAMSGNIQAADKGTTNVKWAIAPVPQLKSGDSTTFGSPTAFAINKNSKNAAAARDFVKWATGEKGAAVVAKIGIVPAYRTDAINKIYFATKGMPTDATSKVAFEPKKIGIEMPQAKNSTQIDKILQEEHDLIMIGDKTVSQGIKEMESRVKALQ